jgi:hypothetical protein
LADELEGAHAFLNALDRIEAELDQIEADELSEAA